jgi:2-aminoethylphosphonate transport system permease protein
VRGAAGEAVKASLITGFLASALALVSGTWAALALRIQGATLSKVLGLLFFVPSAVPSVSVGLGLLVAFSHPPLLLNGTIAIVMIAHFVLISAFTFGNVSAGLARLSPDFEQVASSLGARPAYRLWHVTLPLLAPYLVAAFGLSFALSMGELGATVMVYPPGWVTLPVSIFSLTDRGDIFAGAALTMILVVATLVLLLGLERITNRATGA